MTQQPQDPARFPWQESRNLAEFDTPEWSARILDGLRVCPPGSLEPDADRQRVVMKLLREHCGASIARLRELASNLKRLFILKDEIIDMVFVSAIAHQPMLLVGKPGTAKSKIILKFCEGLGLRNEGEDRRRVFQYLLHAFTEPDEILGPVNIEKLRASPPRFERLRSGYITDAEVIFMDEVFRANSAILNALLSVINERQIYEGGITVPARARLIYGASNSTPTARQLEDLRAFYERFIIRVESTFVPMEFDPKAGGPTADRHKLLEEGWRAEVRELRAGYHPAGSAIAQCACLNDILLLNRAVTELWGGADLSGHRDFLVQYHKLVATLAGGDTAVCEIDDRKFIRLLAVIRAHALFLREEPPKRADLAVLRHIWGDLDSKLAVQERVSSFLAGPA